MKDTTKNVVTTALLALTLLASVVAPAVAAVDATGNVTHANETVTVDNDTQSIYVEAENASDVLDVQIAENGTEVANGTLDATNNTTDSYEFEGIDPANHSEYRVLVSGPNNSTVERVDVLTVGINRGGGSVGSSTGNTITVFGWVMDGTAIAVIAVSFVGLALVIAALFDSQ